jgi:hypothetical protein
VPVGVSSVITINRVGSLITTGQQGDVDHVKVSMSGPDWCRYLALMPERHSYATEASVPEGHPLPGRDRLPKVAGPEIVEGFAGTS